MRSWAAACVHCPAPVIHGGRQPGDVMEILIEVVVAAQGLPSVLLKKDMANQLAAFGGRPIAEMLGLLFNLQIWNPSGTPSAWVGNGKERREIRFQMFQNGVHVRRQLAAEVFGQNADPDQFKVAGRLNEDQPILVSPVATDEWLRQLCEIKTCLKNHAFTVWMSLRAGQGPPGKCEYGGFVQCL